jgi:hypothetical protein
VRPLANAILGIHTSWRSALDEPVAPNTEKVLARKRFHPIRKRFYPILDAHLALSRRVKPDAVRSKRNPMPHAPSVDGGAGMKAETAPRGALSLPLADTTSLLGVAESINVKNGVCQLCRGRS